MKILKITYTVEHRQNKSYPRTLSCFLPNNRTSSGIFDGSAISNNVYEINIDSEYEHNIKNDMFNNILDTKMIL